MISWPRSRNRGLTWLCQKGFTKDNFPNNGNQPKAKQPPRRDGSHIFRRELVETDFGRERLT